MTEIEEKDFLIYLQSQNLVDRHIIEDVYQIYLRLKKAGEPITLTDVFINRGLLTQDQIQSFNQETSQTIPTLQKIGDYKLLKKLGHGGMGSVFLAQKNTPSSEIVALKVLPKVSSINSKAITRFQREFHALRQLNHPAIIKSLEEGFGDGFYYYTMEYLDAPNLKTYLEWNKPLDFKKAVSFIYEIAQGLQHANAQGILHRDIKPENILITKDEKPKLIDFGLAKIMKENENELTGTQSTMGTPYFMSKEQAQDAKTVDFRSDIYSLGATLFYMVTGQYPVQGKTTYEILVSIINGKMKDPQKINAEIPNNLNTLLFNMMGKNTDERYSSYEHLLHDLNAFLHDKSIKPISSALAQKKTHRTFVLLLSLLLLGAITFFYANQTTSPEAQTPVITQPPTLKKTTTPTQTPEPSQNDLVFKEIHEIPKEVLKYRIVNSFDREFKRQETMANYPHLDHKLEEYLDYLASHEVLSASSLEEGLLTRAFTLLAFCGAGYDFYQAPEREMMGRYLRFIIDAQIEPGKWSSELWINTICTNTIIESFAMYGSANTALAELALEALSQLENQFNSFLFSSTEQNILGSHLFITAFTFSRIAGLPKYNQMGENHLNEIRKITEALVTKHKYNKDVLLTDQLDVTIISQFVSRTRESNTLLRSLEREIYIPQNCKEAYFMILLWSLRRDRTANNKILTNITSFFDKESPLTNEVKQYSNENGLLITYAIAALAIENIYRIPSEAFFYRYNQNEENSPYRNRPNRSQR